MKISHFSTSFWKSRFWKWKVIYRAMIFAWKNPRHVQISVDFGEEGKNFEVNTNYAGLNERGLLKVLQYVGNEAREMELTEFQLKEILKKDDL